jgi:hypothetical protein
LPAREFDGDDGERIRRAALRTDGIPQPAQLRGHGLGDAVGGGKVAVLPEPSGTRVRQMPTSPIRFSAVTSVITKGP